MRERKLDPGHLLEWLRQALLGLGGRRGNTEATQWIQLLAHATTETESEGFATLVRKSTQESLSKLLCMMRKKPGKSRLGLPLFLLSTTEEQDRHEKRQQREE